MGGAPRRRALMHKPPIVAFTYAARARFLYGPRLPAPSAQRPRALGSGGNVVANFHVIAGRDESPVQPVVRNIGAPELTEALRKGLDDFKEMPTHLAFIGLIYPLLGVCLAALTFSTNALPLVFPLVSGFALLGPL